MVVRSVAAVPAVKRRKRERRERAWSGKKEMVEEEGEGRRKEVGEA